LDTTVLVKGAGLKYMKDVIIGDMVMTASGEYQAIYTIDHLVRDKKAFMVQFFLSGNNSEKASLKLTPNHMVFSSSVTNSNPIAASSLRVGDFVQTLNGPKEITKIITNQQDDIGYINMLTAGGTIIVGNEGIVGSTYAANSLLASTTTKYSTKDNAVAESVWNHNQQNYFHEMVKPLKFFCLYVSSSICELPEGKEVIYYAQFGRNVLQYVNDPTLIMISSYLFNTYILNTVVEYRMAAAIFFLIVAAARSKSNMSSKVTNSR